LLFSWIVFIFFSNLLIKLILKSLSVTKHSKPPRVFESKRVWSIKRRLKINVSGWWNFFNFYLKRFFQVVFLLSFHNSLVSMCSTPSTMSILIRVITNKAQGRLPKRNGQREKVLKFFLQRKSLVIPNTSKCLYYSNRTLGQC
jgi:hypothetical protein